MFIASVYITMTIIVLDYNILLTLLKSEGFLLCANITRSKLAASVWYQLAQIGIGD